MELGVVTITDKTRRSLWGTKRSPQIQTLEPVRGQSGDQIPAS